MKKKIRIGFVGCGQFCRHFVPLFKAHPAVEYIAVCDKFRERAVDFKEKFGADEIFDTYDEMVTSLNLNAIAIFSQRDTHGEMAIKALKNGKNVYSAVPMATSIEDIEEIVRLVKETGLTYSMGETGIYRPASIFCRQKYASGEIGRLVYAEAQYNHDMERLYDVYQYTEGDKWKQMAGMPPIYYPTHSTSMVLSATKARALKVSAFGYEDKVDPDIFGEGKNYWDNPFSNTSMLLKMSDDSIVRISENRRVAWHVPETYITTFNGEKASYECSLFQHSYIKMKGKTVDYEDVSDLLNPIELTKNKTDVNFMQKAVNGEWSQGEAPIQIVNRLPKEFDNIKTGHAGTHKFMVDDFCQAYVTGKLSPTNAWQSARYNIPGLTAFKSAMQGGKTLDILDLGNPPSELEVLSEDRPINENNYDEYRKPNPLPQLIMRINLNELPPLELPNGYSVHTHQTGKEKEWEEIVESSFDMHFDFDFLIRAGHFNKDHIYYLNINGEDVATLTAVEHDSYPGEGWLRVLGLKKSASGKGLGKLMMLIALYKLKERGYKTAVLSTDDFRIPALCTYLGLGFKPVYNHESHQERWQKLKETLPEKYSKYI